MDFLGVWGFIAAEGNMLRSIAPTWHPLNHHRLPEMAVVKSGK